jgi:hypothetical protein
MIERAIAARVPFGWAAADEGYGDNGPSASRVTPMCPLAVLDPALPVAQLPRHQPAGC